MNLADAIRQAALSSGAPIGQPEPSSPQTAEHAAVHPTPQQGFVRAEIEGSHLADEPAEKPAKEQKMKQQHDAADTAAGHNIVRLELVLNPEQLKGFFGAVIASQHSVLTLREAASYLRVSQRSLEALAEDGEVPGMMVDGKWRFTRQALEDWLSANPQRKEA